jgi:hypothetical protein
VRVGEHVFRRRSQTLPFAARLIGNTFSRRPTLRRGLEQRKELLDPFFVTKIEVYRSKTITIFNPTAHFSSLGKVVPIAGDYQMRVKGVAAYFAVSVLVVTGARIVLVHGA